MGQVVLIVDDTDRRRAALAGALRFGNRSVVEARDAFEGMAALGRADFGAIVVNEGRRLLSLRGFIQLARKRHKDVGIWVLLRAGSAPEAVHAAIGQDIHLVTPDQPTDALVGELQDVLAARAPKPIIDPAVQPADPMAAPIRSLMVAGMTDVEGESTPGPTTVSALVRASAPAPLDTPLEADPTETGPAGAGPLSPAPSEPLPTPPAASGMPAAPGPEVQAPAAVIGHAEPAPPSALLEGSLEQGSGASVLASLFSQELTGRLDVSGGSAPCKLWFYRGEPVWGTPPGGDADLAASLVGEGQVPAAIDWPTVPEGGLARELVRIGHLTADGMKAHMLKQVRSLVLHLSVARTGQYAFFEDLSLLQSEPLFSVNPFGLMLEARRTLVRPDRLLALASELGPEPVSASLGLSRAMPKLRPFVRGQDLGALLSEEMTAEALFDATGLDHLMGALMLITLLDARLIYVGDGGSVQSVELTDELMDDDDEDDLWEGESAAPFEIFTWLGPLKNPRDILGVALSATRADIDAAYQKRLGKIDALTLLPEASDIPVGGIEQMRGKLREAHRLLMEQ